MGYFCTCKKCRISSQDKRGHFLKTKKTYRKHQKAELLISNISNDSNNLSSTDSDNDDDDNDEAMEISSEDNSSDKQISVFELFQSIIKKSLR